MASDREDLRRRIEALERRVAELEAAPPQTPPTVRPLPLPPPGWEPSTPVPLPLDFAPVTTPPHPQRRSPPAPPSAAATSQPPTRRARNLERFVGGRAYAAIGAVVIVIGVGMFLKLAVERGWFSFPPAARCAAAGGFGLLLLAAGEWARRKLGAAASVGLSAAGIATTYAAIVAAYGWYGLFGGGWALALLAFASCLGIAVALRAGQALLAWIALVAAYATPIVLWRADLGVLVTPLYLLSVLAFALVLAARRPAPFASVRGLAWLGSVLIGTAWGLGAMRGHAAIVSGFALAVWMAVHAELAIGAPAEDRAARGLWRRALLSVGSTTWAAVLGAAAAHGSRTGWAPGGWMVTGAMFVGACTLAHVLGGSLVGLAERPRTERQRLGAVLWLVSGALLIATVAMGIDGSAEVVCWLALGAAAVIASRWLGIRALAVYGLLVLAIAAGRLILWESWHGGPGRVVLGLYMNRWTALAASGAACFGACASLLRARAWTPAWRASSDACILVGAVLAFAAAVHERSDQFAMVSWGSIVAGGLWGLAFALRSTPLGVAAAIGTSTALVAAVGHQYAGFRRNAGAPVLGLHLGPWSALVGLIAGIWAGAARVAATARLGWPTGAVVAAAVGAAASLMLLPDLPASRADSCVVWWSLVAVAFFAAHAVWKRALPAGPAFGVLAAAAAAWAINFPLGDWAASRAPAGLHPGLWLGLLLTVLAGAAEWWLRRETRPAVPTANARARAWIVAASATLVVFTATSMEVSRAARILIATDRTSQNAAVSIWWGLFAAALLALGFAYRLPPVRHVGLGLLGVATAKAVVLDLQEVSPEWRVVSFLGLGLLMLGVAIGYARLSRRLDAASSAA